MSSKEDLEEKKKAARREKNLKNLAKANAAKRLRKFQKEEENKLTKVEEEDDTDEPIEPTEAEDYDDDAFELDEEEDLPPRNPVLKRQTGRMSMTKQLLLLRKDLLSFKNQKKEETQAPKTPEPIKEIPKIPDPPKKEERPIQLPTPPPSARSKLKF